MLSVQPNSGEFGYKESDDKSSHSKESDSMQRVFFVLFDLLFEIFSTIIGTIIGTFTSRL